jgi:hypothetical protein
MQAQGKEQYYEFHQGINYMGWSHASPVHGFLGAGLTLTDAREFTNKKMTTSLQKSRISRPNLNLKFQGWVR